MSHECEMPMPGPEHAKILESVGVWDVACKYFMDPSAPPEEASATDTVEAVGGFWTVSTFEGSVMGAPMTGKTTLGWDPMRSKYVMTWVDSMMPHLWFMEGEALEDGQLLDFQGKGPDHTGKGLTDWRITCASEGKNRMILRMFMSTPGGEVMTMENTYTRRT